MTIEELKRVVRRYYEEAITKDDYRMIDEFFDKEVVLEGGGTPPVHSGEQMKEMLRGYRVSFPDGGAEVEDIIAEGDKVAVRGHYYGTQKGEFMGMPATNKYVRTPFFDLWEFRNGKVVHSWSLADASDLLTQLGMMPARQPMTEHVPA